MKICFYNVDLSYIDYLKKYESKKKATQEFLMFNTKAAITNSFMEQFLRLRESIISFLFLPNSTTSRTICRFVPRINTNAS